MFPSRVPPAHEHVGVVVEWRSDKGYGFLDFNGKRIFLHRRDLEKAGAPRVGEKLKFIFGTDAEGRLCARNAVPLKGGSGKLGIGSLIVLTALLVLPVKALLHLQLDPMWLAGGVCAINVITYVCYVADKRRARTRDWRISEATLHLLEFLGGWPAAWIAQRRLNHKVSKRGYQMFFGFILVIHQLAAYDSMQNWKLLLQLTRRLPG